MKVYIDAYDGFEMRGATAKKASDGIHVDMDRLKKGEVKYVGAYHSFYLCAN